MYIYYIYTYIYIHEYSYMYMYIFKYLQKNIAGVGQPTTPHMDTSRLYQHRRPVSSFGKIYQAHFFRKSALYTSL